MDAINSKSTGNSYTVRTNPDKEINLSEEPRVGYSPAPPDDSFKPSDGKEQGFISRVVDKITGFVNNYIVGPGGKFADNLRSDFKTQVITAGIAVGASAGAFIGHQAGVMEQNSNQVSVQTWQEPVTQSKYLGNIPSDYHSWFSSFDMRSYDYDDQGRLIGGDAVHRSAPVFNSDGSVQMREVTKTIDSQRFGPTGGMIGGIALGIAGGTLAAIAINLINKTVKGE